MSNIEVFEPLKHIQYSLAEGILKLEDKNIWMWTDIKEHKICQYNKSTNQYRENHTEFKYPSALFETSNPQIVLVAAHTTLYVYNFATNTILDSVTHPELDPTQTRFNDGKLDRNGRLFIGTLDLHDRPNRAALYRLDNFPFEKDNPEKEQPLLNKATFTTMISHEISLSNGMGWSQDNTKFYFIDTPTRELKIFDYDPKQSTIINPHHPNFTIDLTSYQGTPDGLCVDPKTNHIYIAMWGGGQILKMDQFKTIQIPLPEGINYPTNLTCNENASTFLITTANPEEKPGSNDGKMHILNQTKE